MKKLTAKAVPPAQQRYAVLVTCVNCGTQYEGTGQRMTAVTQDTNDGKPLVGILVWAPATCEDCGHLRVVRGGRG